MNVHSVELAMRNQNQNEKSAPQDKRAAILFAALELFSERGVHGTAVPPVAERAGVGIGTIYRYFETKEALINAVYQQQRADLLNALRTDFPTFAPPREQFHAMWTRMLDYAQENPESLTFLELHHHRSYLDEKSREVEEEFFGWLNSHFQAAVRFQVFKDAPSELLIAIVKGAYVGMMRAAWDGRIELGPEVIKAAEDCCWEAIRR